MQTETPKTNESVKAGIEIESHHLPETETETDADELVHKNIAELPEEFEEQDLDELVHSQSEPSVPEDELEERDADDLVHAEDGGEG